MASNSTYSVNAYYAKRREGEQLTVKTDRIPAIAVPPDPQVRLGSAQERQRPAPQKVKPSSGTARPKARAMSTAA